MNWHLSSAPVHYEIHPNVSFTVISEAVCTHSPPLGMTEPTLKKKKKSSSFHFLTLD